MLLRRQKHLQDDRYGEVEVGIPLAEHPAEVTMPVPDECPCPICQRAARRFDSLSDASLYVDYYRCPDCRHVFTVPKDECKPADDVILPA